MLFASASFAKASAIAWKLSFGMDNGGVTIGGMGGSCPSVVNEICPSHMQVFIHDFVKAGNPCTSISGLPGIQGVVTAGTHGAGVNTPNAAEVAAMTAGLVGAEHMPNDPKLVRGTKSPIFACCSPPIIRVREGLTTSGHGTKPNVHFIMAEVTTYESDIIPL